MIKLFANEVTSSTHSHVDEEDLQKIVTIFKALSDPSRLRILQCLTKGDDLCVSDLAEELNMSISRVSHHLSLLDNLGFLKHTQDGKHVYYTVDDDCITDIMMRAQEHVSGK